MEPFTIDLRLQNLVLGLATKFSWAMIFWLGELILGFPLSTVPPRFIFF